MIGSPAWGYTTGEQKLGADEFRRILSSWGFEHMLPMLPSEISPENRDFAKSRQVPTPPMPYSGRLYIGWGLRLLGYLGFFLGLLVLVGRREFGLAMFGLDSLGVFYNSAFYASATMVLVISAWIGTLGRRLMQPYADEVVRSKKPVLILRAFFRDHHTIERPMWAQLNKATLTFEEGLVNLTNRLGPTEALGRPGELLQPIGASRRYVAEEHWEAEVRRRISESQLVVLIADNTPSLRRELEFCRHHLRRLLIVLPPGVSGLTDRDADWYRDWEQLLAEFPFLPLVDKSVAAVAFYEHSGEYVPKLLIAPTVSASSALSVIRAYLEQQRLLDKPSDYQNWGSE